MSWPTGRSLDGGLDEVLTPEGCGEMWLCGKHVVGPDPEAVRTLIGGNCTIVSFNQPRDIARYPDYEPWLRTSPHALWYPIPDFHAPALDDALPILDLIASLLRGGDNVVMHCSAGVGRAGTMAVAVLMTLGVSMRDALRQVSADRPGAGPEVGSQRDLILSLANHLAT
jgi:hypothetical protein